MSRVPSVEPSSTITISFSRGTACTWRTSSRIVFASLYTGITTDSFMGPQFLSAEAGKGGSNSRRVRPGGLVVRDPGGASRARPRPPELHDTRKTPDRAPPREGGDRDETPAHHRVRREVRHAQAVGDVVSPEIDDRGIDDASPGENDGEPLQVEAPVDVGVRQEPAPALRPAGERVEVRELVRMDAEELGAGEQQERDHRGGRGAAPARRARALKRSAAASARNG